MSNLQNLIERIVESKVASVLEEGLRRKERRKAKRRREEKQGRDHIAKLSKDDIRKDAYDWHQSDPEDVPKGMVVNFGRGAYGRVRPEDAPESGQYTHPIAKEVKRQEGRLKFNKFTKPFGDNKPKGKLP